MNASQLLLAMYLFVVAQAAPGSATISGRVLEAGTNRPVRRAIVTLAGGPLANGRSAVTDDEGQFVIARVPDGDFTLSATRPGYLKAAFGASRPGRPGTPIAVRGGASRSDIAVSMTHGSALAGILRDPSGDPALFMRVEAIRIQHLSTGDRAEKLGEARADDRGEFRIYGLPAGDYILAATPARIVGGLGDLGAPSEAEVDAKLSALKTRSSLPAPGAPAPTPPAVPAAQQEKGYSTPAVFYPGAITPGDAVIITLGANEVREGLDFGTLLSHAATVDGNVVTARGATFPTQLQLALQGSGPQLPIAGGSLNGPAVRQDPATRTFRITNVPPGHYRLIGKTMNAPGSNTQIMGSGGVLPQIDTKSGVLWGALEFDATGEDISGLTLTVQPAPSVTGRLVVDGASKAPASLAGTRVSLEPVPDSDRRSNGLSAPIVVATDAKGAFELPAVIPGAYRVTATMGSGWWLRSAVAGGAGADVLDGVLTVDANGVSDLTLTISDRHSSVGGTLTTAGGPATEYFLVAFTADKTMWRAPSRRVRSTRPATTGAFEVTDLPAGQYYLAALKDLDAADLEDPAFLEALIPAAAQVTVTEGQKTIQDLRIGG